MVGLLVVSAGCAGPAEFQNSSSSDQEPSASSTLAPTPTGGPIPAVDVGLNFTDCKGVQVVVFAPTDRVNHELPAGLRVVEFTPGVTTVLLVSLRCEREAVDGLPVSPSSFAILETAVVRPSGVKGGANRLDYFVLETIAATQPAVSWVQQFSSGVHQGETATSHFQGPAGEERAGVTISSGAATWYKGDGQVYGGNVNKSFVINSYFDKRPIEKPLERRTAWKEDNADGAGVLQLNAGSTLARIFGGAPVADGLFSEVRQYDILFRA